mgnify:CR=1 FL=1
MAISHSGQEACTACASCFSMPVREERAFAGGGGGGGVGADIHVENGMKKLWGVG